MFALGGTSSVLVSFLALMLSPITSISTSTASCAHDKADINEIHFVLSEILVRYFFSVLRVFASSLLIRLTLYAVRRYAYKVKLDYHDMTFLCFWTRTRNPKTFLFPSSSKCSHWLGGTGSFSSHFGHSIVEKQKANTNHFDRETRGLFLASLTFVLLPNCASNFRRIR